MSAARVAILGAAGRMGAGLLRVLPAFPELQLGGAIVTAQDPLLGRDVAALIGGDATGVAFTAECPADVDVAVDFTGAAGAVAWAGWCAAAGVPLVSGSTGLDPAQQRALDQAAERIALLWAANMSVGVTLLAQLVQQAAAQLGPDWDIEIVETHHRAKRDAPSGTALALAQAAQEGRARTGQDAQLITQRSGDIGPRPSGAIGVQAVRMGSVVGEHDVHFGGAGETLTFRHAALDRAIFCRGALRAAGWIVGRRPGRYTMRDVLRP